MIFKYLNRNPVKYIHYIVIYFTVIYNEYYIQQNEIGY